MLLSSCSFVEDDPVADTRILEVDELQNSCEIDAERIKEILNEDVSVEINCIESNLDKFRYVKRQNQDVLSESDIERFIRKYFPEQDQDDIVEGLGLLFQLNTLLLRDNPRQMKQENIKPFFELLRVINKRAIVIFGYVELMDKITADEVELFNQLSKKLKVEFNFLAQEVLDIVQQAEGAPQSINVREFIEKLTEDIDGFSDFKKLLKSLLFVKKLFLGGERETLNSNELVRLFNLFPDLSYLGFDTYLQKEEFFKSTGEYYERIASNIENLVKNVFEHQNEVTILTTEDLYNIIDELYETIDDDGNEKGRFVIFQNSNGDAPSKDEEKQILKDIVKSFKRDIIGGDPQKFSSRDVEITVALIVIGARTFENVTKLSDLVKDIDLKTPEERVVLRGRFVKTFFELSKRAKELINGNTDLPENMKLLKFIQSIAEDTDYIDIDEELLNSIFSLKVAVVGGTREVLKIDEFEKALTDAESISKLFYDLNYRSVDYADKSDQQKFNFFAAQAQGLRDLYFNENIDNDPSKKPINISNIISLEDIQSLAEIFFDKDDEHDKEKIDALVNLVDNFFNNFLINEKGSIDLEELKTTTDMAIIGLRALEFVGYHSDVKDKVQHNCEKLKAQDKCSDMTAVKKKDYINKLKTLNNIITKTLGRDSFLNKEVELQKFLAELDRSRALIDFNTELLSEGIMLKTVVTGGNQTTLKKDELKYLTDKIEDIGSLAFDGLITDFDSIEENIDLYKIFLGLANDFESLVYPYEDENTFYFSIKQILGFTKLIIEESDISDPINPENFKRTIIDFSERVLLGVDRDKLSYPSACQPDPDKPGKFKCSEDDPPGSENIDLDFTKKAMDKLFVIARESIETMIFADATYDNFADLLESRKDSIKPGELVYGKLPEYDLIRDQAHLTFLQKSFSRVAEKFKYFRDDTSFPIYMRTDETYRRKPGFTGIVLWRYLLQYVVIAYGEEKDRTDPYATDGFATEMLNDFLVGVKSILLELDLWTSNFETFGGNILLLADLFQNRSDGTLKVSIDEATEFVELLFTAGTLSTQMYDYMVEVACKDHLEIVYENGKEKTAIKSDCARRQFFETMFNRQNHINFSSLPDMSKYLPRLKEYYDQDKSPNKQNSYDYVRGVETFSRDVPNLDVLDITPWETGDFTLVLGAMLNIESTFIRFDLDNSNILDFDELEYALYNVYNEGIINIASLCGWTRRFSKTVFMYLIKFGKSPPTSDYGATVAALDLIYKPYFKNTRADRLAIGKLLKSLKEENDKQQGDDAEPTVCNEDNLEALQISEKKAREIQRKYRALEEENSSIFRDLDTNYWLYIF